MIRRAEHEASRTEVGADPTEFDIEDGAAEIQRGRARRPQFFGDQAGSGSHGSFTSAVNLASTMINVVDVIRSTLVDTRDGLDETEYALTHAEFAELQKKAASIGGYTNIPYDTVEDFLIILCYIDNISEMRIIADALQIAELDDENIIRVPFAILAIADLHKVAFAASALDGLINMFRKYLRMAQNSNQAKEENIADILSQLSSIVGAMSGLGGATAKLQLGNATDALGNFMSELLTGKRIPMTIIARNPNLQPPSYAGKSFFGEAPTALSNVDIKELFNKKIGCFPKPSNGSGATSFSIQNAGSMASVSNIMQMVSKMLSGSSSYTEGTKKFRQITAIADQIASMTGATTTESIDMRRADNAIPLLAAMSACQSGVDKSLFSNDTFKQGWMLSNSVSNHLQNVDPSFIEAVRKFS